MMLDVWGIASIATKFTLYLGVLTSTGTVLAALAFRLERYRGLAFGFATIGVLGALGSFFLRGAMLTGSASGLVDPEMISLMWSTALGTALVYRLVGLGLLALGLVCGRVGLWLCILGGILAVCSFDHVGHIPGRGMKFLDIALVLHLLAIAFWLGILIPLRRLASASSTWNHAAEVGHRFGVIASFTVPILIIAGGYMSYALVGSFSALWGTGYGQALILKVALVTGLLTLGAVNKVRFIPGLAARNPKAAYYLRQCITIEWVLILAILGMTAVLTSYLSLPPDLT